MIGAYPVLTEAKEALDHGRHEQAARLTMMHLRAHPGEPRGLALLGRVAMKAGALLQAEGFLRRAIAGGKTDMEASRDLAACLHKQERLAESFELYEQILDAAPADTKVRATTALILDKLGRGDEARSIWERALSEEPNDPAIWISYGHNLRAAGQTERAIEAYQRAATMDPERGEAWWGRASVKQNVFTDEDIVAMREALEIAVDIANVAPLHFSLGRALDRRKQYEQAFEHYTEANRLWAESINYNADELTEEIDESRQLFTSSYFQSISTGGAESEAPIFIVSLPRSGSTLLEQMLGCHQEIEPLGELSYVPALLRGVMEKATQRGGATVPKAIAQLSPLERTQLGEEYLRRAALHRTTNSPRFTDKLPHNWSNSVFIRHILPNAKIIDIRRDAVACCFANFTHSFTRAHASSFALRDIGRAYVDYVRLMDHLDVAAPGMIRHVRYENLIDHPESELQALLDYLGLPWDESCLRFYESDRTVRTPSAEQVRRPLNREGMGAWKPYAQWLDPLREALGPLATS